MKIEEAWDNLYSGAMSETRESQIKYLTLISEQVRQIPLQFLLDEQAVFIPNDDYVAHFCNGYRLGDAGFYYQGKSIWSGYLIFPIRSANNKAKGIGGFNPQKYLQAKETDDYSQTYYSYSSKQLFNKGDYLFWGVDGFKKAYKAGYVIVVDGMFDAIQLRGLGYQAAALMGSSLTDCIISQLRFFEKVIVISDNDEAGFKLEKRLKKSLRNCVSLHQGFNKDVDGAIKNGFSDKIIKVIDKMINEPFLVDYVVR